jgi:hypothetical protein
VHDIEKSFEKEFMEKVENSSPIGFKQSEVTEEIKTHVLLVRNIQELYRRRSYHCSP